MYCKVCNSEDLFLFLDLNNQPHCNSLITRENLGVNEPFYPLRTVFCRNCTTVQLDHTLPKEDMFSEYFYMSGSTVSLCKHFEKTTDKLVKKLELTDEDFVVDIGSNDGTWLSYYGSHKVKAIGVEPAKNLAELANNNGYTTINEFFNEKIASKILQDYGYPKLVTAAGVFFHLEELHSVTKGIADLIKKDGVFYAQVIYLGEIIKNVEFDNIYHEHLTLWSMRSVAALLGQYNLEIFDANLIPIHGGSLELFIAAKGSRKTSNNLAKLIEDEKRLKLDNIETYKDFANKVWEIKEKLMQILLKYKAEGKAVFAFGAPAKGATLLNSFGIDSSLVHAAIETNELKIGKFIPGARIEILDENKAPKADAYLILPWNFLRSFLDKMKNNILSGQDFIVPIPHPFIINKNNYFEIVERLENQTTYA